MSEEELEKLRRRKLEELMRDMQKKREVKNAPISEPIKVTDSNFNEVIRSSSLVVIDFWAPWCAPCRMMIPIVDELAREYAGKILFGKLNVDENQRVPAEYQIMGIPTFLIFKDGALVERIVGAIPKNMFKQKLDKYIRED
ncbi:MAG: thioredoxin [Candidatus Bathyarchaeia archaeon]